MHTEKAFADTLVRFGDCARTAVEMTAGIRDPKEQVRRLSSIIRAMSRFFWFTVEFGLMKGARGTCAYGSGLLSSFGELQHAIESDEVQRFPLQLEALSDIRGFVTTSRSCSSWILRSPVRPGGPVEQWMRDGSWITWRLLPEIAGDCAAS
jgi:hypothetical protein